MNSGSMGLKESAMPASLPRSADSWRAGVSSGAPAGSSPTRWLQMSTNGQTEARKLRSRLSHPIIDADGHWIEYSPVMREAFRRIGGDAAVEGLDAASQRVPNSLRMSVAE